MTLGNRIREYRKQSTVAEFCSRFSIHKNTLANYENDKRRPDTDFISAFCKEYQLNAHWVIFGEGPRGVGDYNKADLDQDILKDAIEGLEDALKRKGRTMSPKDKAEIISEIYMLIVEEEMEESKETLAKILRLVA